MNPGQPTPGPSPFSFGTKILGAGAVLLFLFIGAGFALPGTWEARGTRVIEAPPETLFGFLDGPEGWRRWTTWPDSVEAAGPARGPGARMSWENLDVGNGVFEIVSADRPTRVEYRVTVQDSSLHTAGTVRLEPVERGTRVHWEETGDFGWNPLMGYWALLMDGVQSREMDRNLERLEAVATGREPEPAAR
ncbi:MAG: SRPBCC family protein [Longimicrobiales bacterium]